MHTKINSSAKNVQTLKNRPPPLKKKMTFKKSFQLVAILWMALNILNFNECDGLNVTILIDPPVVRRGEHVLLRCLYDLKHAPLYAAKFYWQNTEFYRYLPEEIPPSQPLPHAGIHIDESQSNATQVFIPNVGFSLMGIFKCEVSADAPTYSTGQDSKVMYVVELPDSKPEIVTDKSRYVVGDVLRANCTSGPSRPSAELKFSINNMVIGGIATEVYRVDSELTSSFISMTLQLQPVHFLYNRDNIFGDEDLDTIAARNRGPYSNILYLKCSAQVKNFYHDYTEVELTKSLTDPIPSRVTSALFDFFRNTFGLSTTNAAGKNFPTTINIYFVAALSLIVFNTIFSIIQSKQILNIHSHTQRNI